MQIIKIEAGEYQVLKDNIVYIVSKDSYTGGWSVHSEGKYITYQKTKEDCLDFIERGYSVKILDSISVVPGVEINTKFIQKGTNNDRLWTVDDVVYSSAKGKWIIKGYYCNDSIDEGRYSWDADEFEEECEVVQDGCGRNI